jgi:DNA polymerase III alpha subunit
MILNEQDVVESWLKDTVISNAVFTDVEPINIYNNWCSKYDIDETIEALYENNSENYIEECIQNWHMPEEYKDIDIIDYLLNKCKSEKEKLRVLEELTIFKERGMLVVLKFLNYLVDVCKQNDIVLGVGRGSSVASYCLYLLGVHRIDSIKYELDIKEFLK